MSASNQPGRAKSKKVVYEETGGDWLDRLTNFQAHFGRFARDVAGVLLLAFSLVTVLGLIGLTKGTLLAPLVRFLWEWLGFGSFLVVIGLGAAGILILRRDDKPLPWGRIIALEVTAFLTMGLLALLGGMSLTRAAAGYDGGYIGWGLVSFFDRLFGRTASTLLISIAWIFFSLTGLGLWERIENWLLKASGDQRQPEEDERLPAEETISPETTKTKPGRSKRPAIPIPPEFRKSFRVQETPEEQTAQPPPRNELLPPLKILADERASKPDERTINQTAGLIEKTLSEFGIPAQVIGFRIGPTITQFAVQPGFFGKNGESEEAQRSKVRVAQIASLQRDLALALSAERLRIEAPVPGKPYVGIEVPNAQSTMVRLKPILQNEKFYKVSSPLAIALGRDVSGQPVVADLARMPHLLIAGATGSGKSVCITSLAACLAMNNSPEDLRMVMIDSKMVELIRFNGLPHLYGKVETDIKRIMAVLRWVVTEMERRYLLLESARSRDVITYNRKMERRKDGKTLPRIVVLIDELADLMMSSPDQTEHNLVRLAQMARATGIHLIVATQRPSTDVVTGLIKANFPARLAFAVASGVDSRVILDSPGAESLLGRGDMLFLNPESGTPLRAQGILVSDQEIEKLITHWQDIADAPHTNEVPPWETLLSEPEEGSDDALVEQAIAIVRKTQRASASMLQRRLRIGYPRAARLLDQLEEMGVVGETQGGGKERDVLLDPNDDDWDEER